MAFQSVANAGLAPVPVDDDDVLVVDVAAIDFNEVALDFDGLVGEYSNQTRDFPITVDWSDAEALQNCPFFACGRARPPIVLIRVDPTINFEWDASPGPGVDPNSYGVRWAGALLSDFSETYTFFCAPRS